ncbi:hypothetical protein PAXRUDRAFT_325086 [Paxillus rubicundulus Ve08.2h10]|uniref:Uncharacterized protein n=1 Tax=Paxillus rubicundulus Ve08.2h10 TaxID=930991 RepID=A0A0D0CSX9_9AGAM|nr:hypothetical protein PAXRUDRAFT_325086 [Paxillus rubicundulus Ve08.2h10]
MTAMVIQQHAAWCCHFELMLTQSPRRHCHQPFKAPMQCSDRTRRLATALSKIVFSASSAAGRLWTGIVRGVTGYAESTQANSSPWKNQSVCLTAAVCSNAEAS